MSRRKFATGLRPRCYFLTYSKNASALSSSPSITEEAVTSVLISEAGFEISRTMSGSRSTLSNLPGRKRIPAPMGKGSRETSAGCAPHTATYFLPHSTSAPSG